MPKKKSNIYFTQDTEDKIQEYIKEPSKHKRDLIYLKHLQTPIRKIVEVYHSKMDTFYIEESREDAINDCISSLMTEAIFKLDNKKGKAYSYLSVSARNHFIQLNNKNYRYKTKKQMDYISPDVSDYYIDESINNSEYNKEFLKRFYSFIQWMKENIDKVNFQERRKNNILALLEYMETFDTDSYFKKDVIDEIHTKYGLRKGKYDTAKHFIWKCYVYYCRQVEMEKTPDITMIDKGKLTEDQIQWIRNKYQHQSHTFGVTGLSERFNISEHKLKTYLTR